MALYTPSVDYRPIGRAIDIESSITQMGHEQEQQKIQSKMRDIQGQQLDLQRNALTANIVFGALQLGLDAASLGLKIADRVQESQLTTAKNDALKAASDLNELAAFSIQNHGTNWVIGDDGNPSIEMDPSLLKWRDDQIDFINNTKDSKAVKEWRLAQMEQTWVGLKDQLVSGLLKETQATTEAQYNMAKTSAMQIDVRNGGSYEMGLGVINARNDLTPIQKEIEAFNYMRAVDVQSATEEASSIAMAQGLDKAIDYVHAKDNLSIQEKQSIISSASTTDRQVTASVTTSAQDLMSQGLEAGATPISLYERIDEGLEGMPEYRVQEASDAARKAHIEWATRKGYEITNKGLESTDVDFLKAQSRSITQKDGALYNSVFYKLDQTAAVFANMYDKRVADIEKELASALTAANKQVVSDNINLADATFSSLQAGDISPHQAMQAVQSMDVLASEDEITDDIYQQTMLNKINDNIVPERYRSTTSAFLNEMNSLKWGMKVKKSGLTAEQSAEMVISRDYANEAIANIFMSTSANDITQSELNERLQEIKNTFIGKSIKILEEGVITDRFRFVNDPDALDDALTKNHKFGDLEGTVPLQLDKAGNIIWANLSYKETYDAVSGGLEEILKGEGVDLKGSSTPLKIDGTLVPVPTFIGRVDGLNEDVFFTFNRDDIFISQDGRNWSLWTTVNSNAKYAKKNTWVDDYFDKQRDVEPKDPFIVRALSALSEAWRVMRKVRQNYNQQHDIVQ